MRIPPVFILFISIACGTSTPSEQAADFLDNAVSCIERERNTILNHLNSGNDAFKQLSADFFGGKSAPSSDQEVPSLKFEELCDIDFNALPEEARAIVESEGKQIVSKVMPAIMGAAFSSFSGDSGDSNEAILDTVISALREASDNVNKPKSKLSPEVPPP